MSKEEIDKATHAAMAVMTALQPLSSEEKFRVLQSAAALFGLQALSVTSIADAAPLSSVAATSPASVAAVQGTPPVRPGKPMSLVELIKEKSPASNDQRIACFAYYREKHEGKENFSSADLSAYFSIAKLAAPGKNYMRDYNKAVKQAWIHDSGANSYLTQEGEEAVVAGFAGKRKSPKVVVKRKSGKPE